MVVNFLPSNKTVQVQAGDSLLDAASKAGIDLNASCGGRGACGKCKVLPVDCRQPLSPEEERLLSGPERRQGYRLACKVNVISGMTVEVPGSQRGADRKKRMNQLPEWFVPDLPVKKLAVQVEKASMDNQKSDFERMLAACGLPSAKVSTRILSGLHNLLESSGGNVTVTVTGDEVIDVEAGDTSGRCFGLAFDIGTTTVVGMLWDLNEKRLVDVEAKTNPQSVFGADVISRIQYSAKSAENLSVMKQKIIDCCNDMIEDLSVNNSVERRHMYSVAVVGNTTMSHLFLGIDPAQMARTPFAPVFCKAVSEKAGELRLSIHPAAEVYLLPNIAGHVGSDITAALLSCRLKELPGANLLIDIGTNGEILLVRDGQIMACSTAAGPAFEGAAIYQGMRATAGAIEGVSIQEDGEVVLDVIEDEEAAGICGSGLIDAVAELVEHGLMDRTGRILTKETALERGFPEKLAGRLYDGEMGGGFILYEGPAGNVVLTQKDVREVQLAKGAISAGIKLMMGALGLEPGDLAGIMIAGAFGNYIKKKSALRIGLLPDVAENKVSTVGNSAGTGASMALLSAASRRKAEQEASQVVHLELATHPEFQEEYLAAMYFPESEKGGL